MVYILLMLLSCYGYSQKFNFTHYTVEEGLTQSQVDALFQDSRGYLWIGTRGGVSRFDGKHFRNWGIDDGIPEGYVTSFAETATGQILVGTRKGLVIIEGESLSVITTEDGLPSGHIGSMTKDEDKIWLATSKGLCFYKNGKIHEPSVPLPAGNVECQGIAGGDNFPLYVNSKGIVYILKNNTWDSIVKPDNATISMALDKEGALWIGNWSADFLSCWKNDSLTNFNEFIKGAVTNVYVDSKNNIWVSTWENGVYHVAGDIITNYSTKNGLLSNSFWGVTEDDEGNIWFGSFGGGLYKYAQDPFFHYDEDHGLPSTVINALYADSKGRLWVGTDNGIVVGTPQENKSIVWENGIWEKKLNGKKVVSFLELKDGGMAMGSYSDDPKMVILRNNQLISYQHRAPAPVFCLYENDDRTLFAGTDFQGIFKTGIQGDELLKTTAGGNRIINLSGDNQGNIWCATYGSGVNILIKDSIHVFNKAILRETTVSKCLPGFNQEMWIATEKKGIYITQLNEQNELLILDSLNTTNGAINNKIVGLRKDSKGRIWAGTSSGIMIISKNKETLEVESYGKSEGFVHPECGFDGFAQINNVMYIATSSGITAMDINKTLRDNPINRLTFHSLQLEYADVEQQLLGETDAQGFPKSIVFNYDQNHLTFVVNAIHFTKPEKVRYQFWMENLNEKWSPLLKEGKMTYSSIPPGKYTLHIQSLIEGHSTGVNRQITVIISPPFWKEIWFVITSIFTGFILLIIIYRWRINKMQKDKIKLEKTVTERTQELRKQKEVVEEKNKEILDSIAYAKRIQEAILPPKKVVKQYLVNSFILYKPKDIVAGDFYWMEHKDNLVLFAAADCTGHGVPGAMVSVVCSNALNYGVREQNITDPGKLLDLARELVVDRFIRSEDEVKDGMDIALCSLELHSTGKKKESKATLKYAGAHNPLWVVRASSGELHQQTSNNNKRIYLEKGHNYELLEIKANKQPIGHFDHPEPYTTHTLELQKGDTIYIFSDGYVDQFGGEKGKKFKTKSFRNLLLSIQDKTMEEQYTIIDEAFEKWKGNLEQIDDVCVIGVKI